MFLVEPVGSAVPSFSANKKATRRVACLLAEKEGFSPVPTKVNKINQLVTFSFEMCTGVLHLFVYGRIRGPTRRYAGA